MIITKNTLLPVTLALFSSGYCIQLPPSATQFDPGVGSDWSTAWTKLN
ncbi:hypothetical protein [Photobacterium profundum]|nr:hypothetical protein [Photobacterium profundum]